MSPKTVWFESIAVVQDAQKFYPDLHLRFKAGRDWQTTSTEFESSGLGIDVRDQYARACDRLAVKVFRAVQPWSRRFVPPDMEDLFDLGHGLAMFMYGHVPSGVFK